MAEQADLSTCIQVSIFFPLGVQLTSKKKKEEGNKGVSGLVKFRYIPLFLESYIHKDALAKGHKSTSHSMHIGPNLVQITSHSPVHESKS